MTLSEIVYDNRVGAAVQYGKTSGGDLKALLVDDDGNVLISSAPVFCGSSRKTMAGAAQEVTIPSGAKRAHIFSEGGDIRFDLNADATSSSAGYVAAGGAAVVYLGDVTKLSVYGPTGAYANVVFYG